MKTEDQIAGHEKYVAELKAKKKPTARDKRMIEVFEFKIQLARQYAEEDKKHAHKNRTPRQ